VATLQDYEMARELLNDLLSQGIGATVSGTIRKTVTAVRELTVDANPPQEYATNKDVEGKLKLDKSSVSARVNKALSEGYLVNLQEPERRGNKLAVGSDLPEDIPLLPEPQDMARVYMNSELATLCNLVCQLGSTQRGKPDASPFTNLVGKIVGIPSLTKPSVSTSVNSYHDVFGLNRPDSEGDNHEEEETHRTPPEPSQLTNYVTKSPESVTSSDGSEVVQPTRQLTRPTKVETCGECGIRPVWHGGDCKPCSDLMEGGANIDPPPSFFHVCASCGEEHEFSPDAFGDYQCGGCGYELSDDELPDYEV
jgi:hypothetical protein